MKAIIHFIFAIFVLFLFGCKRDDLLKNFNQKILLNEVKTSFLDKKANLSTKNQSLNFKQSIPRTILWDQAREGKDSSLLVPIHLTLIKDSIIRSADGIPLNGNI